MNREQQMIWEYLLKNALGKANAKKISDIAAAVGITPKGTNNDDVRSLMTEMIKSHGKQIGTLPVGAFVILDDDEREAAAKYVERDSKAAAIRRNGNYNP